MDILDVPVESELFPYLYPAEGRFHHWELLLDDRTLRGQGIRPEGDTFAAYHNGMSRVVIIQSKGYIVSEFNGANMGESEWEDAFSDWLENLADNIS